MTATAVWASVVADYDSRGLIQLTNPRDRAATIIDTATGESASQSVLDLWPAFAQVDFDATDNLHVEVAKQGTIAMLWRRGGSSTSIENVKWDTVFANDGLMGNLKRTDPRGRQMPKTNSGVRQRAETSNGRQVYGWSDPDALPRGRNYMPHRIIARF